MQIPVSLTFDDVLLVPAYSEVLPAAAQPGVDLGRGVRLEVPLFSAAMDTVTEHAMGRAMARAGGLGILHKNNSIEAQVGEVERVKSERGAPGACCDKAGNLRVGAAIGVGGDASERLAALLAAGADLISIDTAHGHSLGVLSAVRQARAAYPNLLLAAGNVATAEGTRALIDAGVDIVKVGMGPGSICTTRLVAGIGVPQLSAVLDCAAAAVGSGACLVADGGMRYAGDLTKALAAGAHVAMLGSVFAGTDEAPGEVVVHEGKSYKAYRGMGSRAAMQAGSADRYFQAEQQATPGKLVAEGVEAHIPYKGPVAEVLAGLVGGLRAGMGYVGAVDLAALRQRGRFVRLSAAGIRESRVHDVHLAAADPYA
jgi:IMP dehydrogenase